MSIANSTQHSFSLVPEVTYGTTPANPAFKKKGITATSLALAKGTVESETIRPDRQVEDVRHTTRQVGGDLKFELTADGFHDILEALLCGTWTGDVLKGGTTRRSFTVLRQFGELAQADKPFQRAVGVEFNTLELSIKPEELVSCSCGLIGQNMFLEETAPAGSVFTNPTTKKPFDAFSGAIELDGTALAVATEIQLTVENGMDPRFVIGSDTMLQPKIGRFRVTGTISAHFQNAAVLEKFFNEVETALSFTLTDAEGYGYEFTLPRIKLNGGQPDVEGEADIVLSIPFQAIYDATEGTALKVQRFVP